MVENSREDAFFNKLRLCKCKNRWNDDKIVEEIYNYNTNLPEKYRKSIYADLDANKKINENIAKIVRDYTWLEKDRILMELLK